MSVRVRRLELYIEIVPGPDCQIVAGKAPNRRRGIPAGSHVTDLREFRLVSGEVGGSQCTIVSGLELEMLQCKAYTSFTRRFQIGNPELHPGRPVQRGSREFRPAVIDIDIACPGCSAVVRRHGKLAFNGVGQCRETEVGHRLRSFPVEGGEGQFGIHHSLSELSDVAGVEFINALVGGSHDSIPKIPVRIVRTTCCGEQQCSDSGYVRAGHRSTLIASVRAVRHCGVNASVREGLVSSGSADSNPVTVIGIICQ